jgi:hypothetical protein
MAVLFLEKRSQVHHHCDTYTKCTFIWSFSISGNASKYIVYADVGEDLKSSDTKSSIIL